MSRRSVTRAEAWALRLLPYRFRIERIPGHLNVADALSRLISRSQNDDAFDEDNDKHLLYTLDAGHMSISWAEIHKESEIDNELCDVRMGIKSGIWPRELRRYESQSKYLRSMDSLVFKDHLIVLPTVLRKRALEAAHEGHLGCGATKRILREYFWWPNMSKEAENYVVRCETCRSISRKNPPIPLCSRILPNGPWEVLQIDFLFIQNCGTGHFLMCVDTYSRYLHVLQIRQIDASHTNAVLCKIFAIWGLPLVLQSDNGPPFQSKEFVDYWEEKGVRVYKSIPLSAQSNGAIERQNQGVIKAIAAAKAENKSWKIALEQDVHVHNTRKQHSRLGVTPFELLVGWRYRGTFPSLWHNKAELDRKEVLENDTYAKLVSKQYADKRRGAKESDIKAGDKVVVSIAQHTKTDPSFSSEKYIVLARQEAKVVKRSEDGVQLARNIQDVKKSEVEIDDSNIGVATKDSSPIDLETPTEPLGEAAGSTRDDETSSLQNDELVTAAKIMGGRPKRTTKKPERYVFVQRF